MGNESYYKYNADAEQSNTQSHVVNMPKHLVQHDHSISTGAEQSDYNTSKSLQLSNSIAPLNYYFLMSNYLIFNLERVISRNITRGAGPYSH